MTRVALKLRPQLAESERPKIMLDSGAFTTWKQGQPMQLDEYIAFVKANLDWADPYAALDVIAPDDPERAAREGFSNLLYMRAQGLDPIPVYHIRESIDWLYRMLDEGCTYIGLAALSAGSRSAIDDWFEMVWQHLVDSEGLPIVRVHAFGEARPEILLKYPWHSADASSWLKGSMYGVLFLENGQRLYHSRTVQASKQSPDISTVQAEDAEELDRLLSLIGVPRSVFEQRSGRVAWMAKSYCAARYYLRFAEEVRNSRQTKSYSPPTPGLVVERRDVSRRTFDPRDFTMYHALSSSGTVISILHVAGAKTMLASFPYVKNWASDISAYMADPDGSMLVSPYVKAYQDLRGFLNASK